MSNGVTRIGHDGVGRHQNLREELFEQVLEDVSSSYFLRIRDLALLVANIEVKNIQDTPIIQI